MYQLVFDTIRQTVACIKRVADNTFIPLDETNTDYQEYLKWLAEGNTPEPASAPAEGA